MRRQDRLERMNELASLGSLSTQPCPVVSALHQSDCEEALLENIQNMSDHIVDKYILRVAVGSTNPSKIEAIAQALHQLLGERKPFVQVDIQTFQVDSGVADQPIGDAATMHGAKTRAKSAFLAYRDTNNGTRPHLAVAIEGGLEWVTIPGAWHSDMSAGVIGATDNMVQTPVDIQLCGPDQQKVAESKSMFCMAWIAVYGKRTRTVLEAISSAKVSSYPCDRTPVYGLARSASFALPPAVQHLVVEEKMELGDADNVVFQRSHQDSKRGQGTVGVLTDGIIPRSLYYQHSVVLALMHWIRPDLYPVGFR